MKKSEITKNKILELGIDLLSKKGYHGTGLSELLKAGNIPKGSFYIQ